MMRVLVCGGRDFANYDYLKTVLSALQVTWSPFELIIHGDAQGADALAEQYARRHQIPSAPYPADWEKHGKAAGPIRNKLMLENEKPDLVVAFKGGRGTADMIRKARDAGVEVYKA